MLLLLIFFTDGDDVGERKTFLPTPIHDMTDDLFVASFLLFFSSLSFRFDLMLCFFFRCSYCLGRFSYESLLYSSFLLEVVQCTIEESIIIYIHQHWPPSILFRPRFVCSLSFWLISSNLASRAPFK